MRATLTAYYNRKPQELAVSKPAGEWMSLDAALKALGFRPVRRCGRSIPGEFEFVTASEDECEQVLGIVKAVGEYLTGGNFDVTFQV